MIGEHKNKASVDVIIVNSVTIATNARRYLGQISKVQ